MDSFDRVYIKSRHVWTIPEGDLVVAWHSLFGYPKIISIETLGFLDLFFEPKTISSQIEYELTDEEVESIDELISCFFLVPHGFDERVFLKQEMGKREVKIANGSLVDYLELIMSEVCNFRCKYCIHFNNLEIHDRTCDKERFMRFDTAKQTIDGYLDILRAHNKSIAEINFGGGEPLMAWDVIKRVLEYCQVNFGNEFQFQFSINTNASLITKPIAETLKLYNVDVASSLDGLEEANNRVRLTKQGGGTFSQILRGFDTLNEVDYPVNGIAVTITEENFHDLDESIIDWACDRGMNNVRIDIDIIGTVDIPIEEIVTKFLRIRRYAKTFNIDVAGFWLRPAENLNESTIEKHIAFCGATRGNSICVSPSGNIFSCGYSSSQLGRMSDFVSFSFPNDTYLNFVKDHQTGNLKKCEGCMIEGQCNGGCNITQEFSDVSGNSKIERMCEFYRTITQEILREQLCELI